MGLKGYRLWVMGQLDSTCRSPPLAVLGRASAAAGSPGGGGVSLGGNPKRARAVALQVAFERQTLKPVFSLDRL
jgi:hypothetical protein